jgi:ATP-dependent DNA ligase
MAYRYLKGVDMSLITKEYASSSSSATYTAQLDTITGAATCNCKGFMFPRPGKVRSCKHTKAIITESGAPSVTSNETNIATNVPTSIGEAIKPMLASAMREDQSIDDFAFGWVMEEKYDGHRLLVRVEAFSVTAWTRPGADRPAAKRSLPTALALALHDLPLGLYDGELFIPGGTSSDVVRLDRQNDLRFVLFDVLEVMGTPVLNVPYSERRALLQVAYKHVGEASPVMMAEIEEVSLAGIKRIWEAGGEGAILKRIDSTYRSGWRSPDWVKVKKIDAAILTITGFVEGKNGPYSVALLENETVATKVKVLDNETLRVIEKDPSAWIGRKLVISYMGRTTSGAYRHPMWDHVLGEQEIVNA